MQRTATAVWNGDLKAGSGHLTTQSATLAQRPYNFVSRFEDGNHTNPEELLAAAHAGCFSMAVAAELGRNGITPVSVTTQAKVNVDRVDGKPTIVSIELHMHAVAPGADRDKIHAVAEGTRSGCIISRALTPNITLATTIDV